MNQYTEELDQKIELLYTNQRMTINQVANFFNMTPGSVRRRMLKAGIAMRSPYEYTRKYRR